jgi:D-alanine-D-alanine ligase
MTKQKKQTKKQATKPTPKKLRIGILFGGRSGEHEVSLLSAASILKAIDQAKYEVIPIGITKQGQWLTSTDARHLLAGDAKPAPIQKKRTTTQSVALSASAGH